MSRINNLLFFLLILSLTLLKISSFDVFWHIVCGNIFFDTGSQIKQNLFSWTYPQHPWTSTYPYFQILTSYLHQIAGFEAIILAKAFLLSSSYYLLFSFIKKKTNSITAFFLLAVILQGSYFRFLWRPHIFSFLFLIIFIILEHQKAYKKPIWWPTYALLILLWSTLHSGVIYGYAFLLTAAAGFTISAIYSKNYSKSNFLEYVLGATLITVVFLFDPMRPIWFSYIFDHLDLNQIIQLEEFSTGSFSNTVKINTLLLFYTVIPFGLLFYTKKIRFLDLFRISLSFYLYQKGIRFFPIVFLMLLPTTLYAIEIIEWKKIASNLLKIVRPWILYQNTILLILIACFFLVTQITIYKNKDSYFEFGFGVSQKSTPLNDIQSIPLNQLQGKKIYNSFSLGGLLLYVFQTKVKVFQDGRIHAYPLEFFNEIKDAKNNIKSWNNYLKQRQINFLILNKEEEPSFIWKSFPHERIKKVYINSDKVFACSLN